MSEATVYVPCPCCFESSGYEWQHGTDWESGPWSVQTNIPCRECNGSGLVPGDTVDYHDEREDDFADAGYEAALVEASSQAEAA